MMTVAQNVISEIKKIIAHDPVWRVNILESPMGFELLSYDTRDGGLVFYSSITVPATELKMVVQELIRGGKFVIFCLRETRTVRSVDFRRETEVFDAFYQNRSQPDWIKENYVGSTVLGRRPDTAIRWLDRIGELK